MRNAFAAETVTAQAAHAQQIAIKRNLDVVRPDAGQIKLYQPTILRAVNVSGRVPQPSRRAPVTQVASIAKELIERSARHISVDKTSDVKGVGWIIGVGARKVRWTLIHTSLQRGDAQALIESGTVSTVFSGSR